MIKWRVLALSLCVTGLLATGNGGIARASGGETDRQTQIEQDWVVPGGQSIGVKLRATGILVVGYHFIHRGKELFSPGERSQVHIGDLIVAVNGHKVKQVDEVAQQIAKSGMNRQALVVEIRRKNQFLTTKIVPQMDDDTGTYRIGLYIRDSASGVGTLTYFDPKRKSFGALGHVVADVDTGEPIEGEGIIVHASVTSIDRGESGQPGEKRGNFIDENRVLGKIQLNTPFGVFGYLKAFPDHSYYRRAIPVARPDEVHAGPVKILTVINNQKVEAFDAYILKTTPQPSADIKSMIIKITDSRLLRATGGIVQGMSGSPIIEDGKLAGAITHVFLSDPSRGYGVYAAWMLGKSKAVRAAA